MNKQEKKRRRLPWSEVALRKDWTKGSILGNLFLLSWPMVLTEIFYVSGQLADMIWIGRLGTVSVAGAGVANIVVTTVLSVDLGMFVGVRALIARYAGSGNSEGVNRVAGVAILMTFIWGIIVGIAGIILAEPAMKLFGVAPEVVKEGAAYMRVMFGGWITLDVMVMALYIVQSTGDTITPLVVEGSIRILHIVLCPFLVLGWWIFPALGIAGAAWSNIISQSIGLVLALWLVLGGRTRLQLTIKDFRLEWTVIRRILKVSIPVLTMNLQRSLGNFFMTFIIAPFGTVAVAAHSLVARVEMFLFMPGMGLGMGAGVLVGQNLGSGQVERAEKSAWLAAGLVEVFMLVCTAVILLWSEGVMAVFKSEPELIKVGAAFMRIATTGYLLIAFSTVLQNSLAGAGDTITNMIISIATVWVIQLPLALALSKYTGFGVYGIRWALVIGIALAAVAYTIYFKTGRWKTKKV